MADNYSNFNSDESADEGPGNPIADCANLRTPEKAKIARERKLRTNPAGKSRSTRGQSDPKLLARGNESRNPKTSTLPQLMASYVCL